MLLIIKNEETKLKLYKLAHSVEENITQEIINREIEKGSVINIKESWIV